MARAATRAMTRRAGVTWRLAAGRYVLELNVWTGLYYYLYNEVTPCSESFVRENAIHHTVTLFTAPHHTTPSDGSTVRRFDDRTSAEDVRVVQSVTPRREGGRRTIDRFVLRAAR